MRQITPWFLSSRGEFLGVLRSNFSIFISTYHSPTREQRGAITAQYLVTLNIEILGFLDKSIYMLLFQKPIQGLSGFMLMHFFPQSMRHSNGLHLLSFACKRDPSQGRSGSWMLLPFIFFKYCRSRISARYCLFLQGVSQHFGCLLLVDSQPCPIQTLT